MAKVQWVKLSTDVFTDEKILLIQALPDGDMLLIIWMKLLCLAGKSNNSGIISITENIPYSDDQLAAVLNRPLNAVKLALATFKKLEMVTITCNGYIQLNNWEKHQNTGALERLKEQNKIRVKNYRERQKAVSQSCNVTQSLQVMQCNATDKDKSKNIYMGVSDGFKQFWASYPKKRAKQDAKKIFGKLPLDDKLLDEILAGLEAYKRSDDWRKDGGQYIPYPATWLNGRRWEDEITPPSNNGKKAVEVN